jgi:hypothetical protein
MSLPPFEVLDRGGGVEYSIAPAQKPVLVRQLGTFRLENRLELSQNLFDVGCVEVSPQNVVNIGGNIHHDFGVP